MSRKEITLGYGRSNSVQFSVQEKNILGILQPKRMRPITNLKQATKEVLRNPTDNSAPFSKIVKPGDRVAIAVSSKERPWIRSGNFIPVLLDELNQTGIPDKDISLIIANGTTDTNYSEKELELCCGSEAMRRVKVVSHDCKDKSQLVYLGRTSRGTRIYLNKFFMEADKRILTGAIAFHYFAGFSGGRKSILPGISGLETIHDNHKLRFHPEVGKGISPLSISGLTAFHGNAVDDDMLETASFAGPNFLLNVIMDTNGNYVKVVAGNYLAAHREGCNFVIQNFGTPIEEKADLVIASEGENPRYTGLFGALFIVCHANMCVKEGGSIIVLADWTEGRAEEGLKKCFQSYSTIDEWEMRIRKNFTPDYADGFSFTTWCSRRNVVFVSSLPGSLVKKTGMVPACSIDEALNIACDKEGKNPKTYILPDAITCAPFSIG